MMPDTPEVIRQLVAIREQQEKTNEHLARLNGKVAKHDQWIAIRTDREEQSEDRGSRTLSSRQFYISQFIAFGILIVAIIAILVGVHHG